MPFVRLTKFLAFISCLVRLIAFFKLTESFPGVEGSRGNEKNWVFFENIVLTHHRILCIRLHKTGKTVEVNQVNVK